MTPVNYYNEFDQKAAAWLRELITAGEIPPGDVDERSITEVKAHEIVGYTQHHFFAGIGGWALALRLAGWPESRPIATASLPCQPFSASGKQEGAGDDRHLWPVFFDLAKECGFERIVGEQVAKAIGFNWLDRVSADLEATGYTVGSIVLGAHSVGAPHRRQRLYWMADMQRAGLEGLTRNGRDRSESGRERAEEAGSIAESGSTGIVAVTDGRHTSAEREQRSGQHGQQPKDGGACGMEHAAGDGREQRGAEPSGRGIIGGRGSIGMGEPDSAGRDQGRQASASARHGHSTLTASSWDDFRIIPCRDGKLRRIPGIPEPGILALDHGISNDVDAGWRQIDGSIFPLAKGVKGRTGLLRGPGNAIVPEVAAAFIQACEEALNDLP